MDFIKQPQKIETRSFEIIDKLIAENYPGYRFHNALEKKIITRAIHTSADFDWLEILRFSSDVLPRLTAALQGGATLYSDTTMVLSGVNKRLLAQFGGEIRCYIADPQVAQLAKEQGITRSMAAVRKAFSEPGNKVFVFGNAPTALFELLQVCEQNQTPPEALPPVIGVPVGFVGAAESKQALYASPLPFITALGRKGGSNIAAAIVNAILYAMRDDTAKDKA